MNSDGARSAACGLLAMALGCGTALAAAPESPEGLQAFSFQDTTFLRDGLRIREDGLLEVSIIASHVRPDTWSGEQLRLGASERREWLVDCLTGFRVDTAMTLLDARDRPIARVETDLDEQLQQTALRRDELRRRHWPTWNEEWMACAFALAPGNRFVEDMERLVFRPDGSRAYEFDYDYEVIGDTPPANTRIMFDRLGAQYDAWRGHYLPPTAAAALTEVNAPAAKPYRGERWLANRAEFGGTQWEAFDMTSLRHRGDGWIDVLVRLYPHGMQRWPEDVPAQGTMVEQQLAIDCRNGLSVPIEQSFRAGKDGKILLQRPAPVFAALIRLAQPGGRETGWSEWQGPKLADDYGQPPEAAQICRAAAERCGVSNPEGGFELTPALLGTEPGAPLLLAARRTWLSHRAGFVPVCRIDR